MGRKFWTRTWTKRCWRKSTTERTTNEATRSARCDRKYFGIRVFWFFARAEEAVDGSQKHNCRLNFFLSKSTTRYPHLFFFLEATDSTAAIVNCTRNEKWTCV